CWRTKSMVSLSPITSQTPNPPGMQMRSRFGQLPKVWVGTKLSPQSLGTGAGDLAMICIADCGKRARTCNGPVKSSCVNCGKITNPTLKTDMDASIGFEAGPKLAGRRADGALKGAVHAAQRAKPAGARHTFDTVAAFEQLATRQVEAHPFDEMG